MVIYIYGILLLAADINNLWHIKYQSKGILNHNKVTMLFK